MTAISKAGKKAAVLLLALALMITGLAGCGSQETASADAEGTAVTVDVTNPEGVEALQLDETAWQYDADNDIYYQIGLVYCTDPDAEEYESLAIYVPGAYMDAEDNGDGTYTCTINEEAEISGYTAATAPIVMPVNTAGYSAQQAASEYSANGLSDYMDAGYIYVYAGCRGRDNGENSDGSSYAGGAPWGVTDLKAAVRYLRYNADKIAGDTDSIFAFGHSGGGAQSTLLGATGDSDLYYAYLEEIGAVMTDDEGNYISDAIAGVCAWCPITNLDTADAAYEWMMGQYSDSGTRADGTFTAALSDDLAEAYAAYINALSLTDADGNILTLEESEDGIYAAGSYYEYLIAVIETSLNNFLADTTFPYTTGQSSEQADGGFAGGGSGGAPSGDMGGTPPDGGSAPSGAPSGDMSGAPSGGMPGDASSGESVTYETPEDYIAALNEDVTWITYDADTNTATVISVEAFVQHCKSAGKDVGAFDSLDLSQAENKVFGTEEENALHFDSMMASLLADNAEEYASYSDYDESYAESYAEGLASTDSLGIDSQTRQNMYNPMYYLSDYYNGYGTSTVAKYWRVHTGIEQSDTSLTTEVNLALALEAYADVESVEFETVWEQGHTTAERTGSSTANMIEWIDSCLH